MQLAHRKWFQAFEHGLSDRLAVANVVPAAGESSHESHALQSNELMRFDLVNAHEKCNRCWEPKECEGPKNFHLPGAAFRDQGHQPGISWLQNALNTRLCGHGHGAVGVQPKEC